MKTKLRHHAPIWVLAFLLLIIMPARAGTVSGFNAANVSIPDYPAAGASTAVATTGAPAGAVITSVNVYYEIRHTYSGDLQVWLTAYINGTWQDFLLRNQVGGSVDDIIETKSNLTFWNGASPNQTWYLVVKDMASGDVGYIDYFEISVEYPTSQPDLTKRTDFLNNLNPAAGNTITSTLTITNQACVGGSMGSGAFDVGFYWSTSASFSGVSPFFKRALGGCSANSIVSFTQDILISSDTAPGIYYLGYKIDSDGEVSECNENNNGIFYWTVTVAAPPQPDLTKRGDFLDNLSPRGGEAITASLTLTNQACTGSGANAGVFQVGFYWSTSSTFTGVTPFHKRSVAGCSANSIVSFSQDVLISSDTAPGTYYFGYKIDSDGEVAECNENNNGIFYWTVTVLPSTPPADIRIQPLTLTFDYASGATMTIEEIAAIDETPGGSILLRTGTINAEDQSADLKTSAAGGEGDIHILMQFQRLPSHAERIMLERSGIKVLRYIPNNAYWVAVSPKGRGQIPGLKAGGGIRWSRLSRDVDKLAPEARRRQFPPNAIAGEGRVEVRVLLFGDVAGENVIEKIEAHDAAVVGWISSHLARVLIAPEQLEALAKHDFVEWIEPAPGPKTTFNAVASQRIQATPLRFSPHHLNGSGVVVGVWDEGPVGIHDDFAGRLTVVDGGSASTHGTHVAGTIGGSGAGDVSAMGMAPGVTLRSYDWNNDMTEMRSGMAVNGVRISNHSYGNITGWQWDTVSQSWLDYGSAGFGYYGTEGNEWDDVVFDTGLIVFKAAGNDRDNGPDYPFGPRMDGPYDSISSDGTGKNIITIGATTDTDGMTAFSSWGPVNDGRIKPDLCANGYELTSTYPNNAYKSISGTSMATPSASGAAALLYQLHTQLTGVGLRADACKALLIHAATDLGRAGPDYEYGWGLINAQASAELMRNEQFIYGTVENGAQQTYLVNVPPGVSVLKATIVWTDPPGSPAASMALVNNLDLKLTTPGQVIVRPWILDPANPGNAALRGVNNRDNVEQVVALNPAGGQWTITVQGTTIAQGAAQPYTLVCEYLAAPNTQRVTIYNDGGETLTVSAIAPETSAPWITWSPLAPFSIAPGESQVVTVSVQLDLAPAGSTTRRLLIQSNDPDESPYPGGVYVETINDERGTVGFQAGTYSVTEGTPSVRIYATRTSGAFGPASVNYATSNGTAVAGQDYIAQSGTLTWADGEAAAKYFDVNILDDGGLETGESFQIQLSGATGAALGTISTTTVAIADNEIIVPSMSCLLSGSDIVISWPSTAADFVLEYKTNLGAQTWTASTVVPTLVNGRYTVVFAANEGRRFFRLRK